MKHIKECFFLALFTMSATASAVIIRHDIEDKHYQIPAATLPALVDFPGEGHGVLIAPQWVVTAAHVACMQHVQELMINGQPREVEALFVHSGYKVPPDELIKEALSSGDASAVMTHLALSDDIALIKLKAPVTDVTPIALYRGSDEIGRTVQLIGKGSTGSGDEGMVLHSSHRTALRRAFNVVSAVDSRWISYTFEAPGAAIALEGISGKGDSGGPLLIEEDQQWQLAGLAAWHFVQGDVDIRTYRIGRYGDGSNNVRISSYIEWIESTISAEELKN